MSIYLHISADRPAASHGGGSVVANERRALQTLAVLDGYKPTDVVFPLPDGWQWDSHTQVWDADDYVTQWIKAGNCHGARLAHFYSGTFTETVKELKSRGCKVVYTIAAHSVAKSKAAHEELGLPYPYPHLTDPELWKRYSGGYMMADLIVCPSKHSAEVVRDYGCGKPIEIIPHGCKLPETAQPLPERFTVGYLGACGAADKGVVDLLRAWKILNYKDATLILAGRDSTSDWVKHLVWTYGGGNIHLAGWQENVSDFYNGISLYVQPSKSEGFGLEVLEAMSYGRLSLCSVNAGACDIIPGMVGATFDGADELAKKIDRLKTSGLHTIHGPHAREKAKGYTWNLIQQHYIQTWKKVIAC